MTSYTPPVSEDFHWHPVYRANALLREALQSTTQSLESLETHYSVEQLSSAIESVLQGPVQITYPRPLAMRLDNLHVEEKRIPGLEAFLRPIQHAPGAPRADYRDDGAVTWVEAEPDLRHDDLSGEAWDDAELALDETPPLRADFPLDPALRPREVQMHTLMGEFQRRQRSASLLVTVSVATAVLLAVGGFVLAASLASPAGAGPLDSTRSTSIAWSKPVSATPGAVLDLTATSANRAAKGEPLPLPAQATPSPQVFLAASGRQIALGSLLPPSLARYVMIRGLPPEARLSAGRQSGGGAWMVKGERVPTLTLTLGQAAAGDYPIEVYILESGDGPQARRSFVLRVTPSDRAALPVPAATPALAPTISAAPGEAPTVPSSLLRDRAMQLLGEGDIAAARMLLLHLAERGDGEAAYDLARTFDREMLAELGAKGVGGDAASARGWYERASQDGNEKAAERLKVLASLSETNSSD
jgi:hypothetical protein